MDRCYKTNVVIIYGSLSEALKYTKYSSKYNKMPRPQKMQLLTNKFYGALGRIILDSDIKPVWVLDEFAAASIICSVAKMQPVERPPIKPHLFKRFTTDDEPGRKLFGIDAPELTISEQFYPATSAESEGKGIAGATREYLKVLE